MTAWTRHFQVLTLAVALLRRKLVMVTVRGISMEPAYHDGDRVLAVRDRVLTPGHVVVAEKPSNEAGWHTVPLVVTADALSRHWMIKRVIALPGDPVPRNQAPALARIPGDSVPPGMVVLFGDNREMSLDSQVLGYFPLERVLGVVLLCVRRRRSAASARMAGPGSDLPGFTDASAKRVRADNHTSISSAHRR